MNTIKFIIVVSIALLSTDLIYHQVVNGQNQTVTEEQTVTQEQRESYLALVNYCYEHADRPNPIQDLIDKGFLSPEFKGETCISVKQTYNTIVRELAIQQEKLDILLNVRRVNDLVTVYVLYQS